MIGISTPNTWLPCLFYQTLESIICLLYQKFFNYKYEHVYFQPYLLLRNAMNFCKFNGEIMNCMRS